MSDNHDLLNDNDMCSFSGHEAEDMCFNCGDHTRRDGSIDVKSGREISPQSLILSHFPDLTSKSITATYHSVGTYQPHRFRVAFYDFHIV